MIRKGLTAGRIAGLLALAAPSVEANEFATRGKQLATYMDKGGNKINPFYAGRGAWSVLPRFSLTGGYDENAFLSPEDPQSASTLSAAPGMLLLYGRPDRNHVGIDYSLLLRLYDSSADVDSRPSHQLTIDGLWTTGKSRFNGLLSFRRLEEVESLLGARVVKTEIRGDTSAETSLSGKSSLALTAQVEDQQYDSEDINDFLRLYGGARLYHRLTGNRDVFFQTGIGLDDQDLQPAPRGDATFYDASIGMRSKQSQKLSVTGNLGYKYYAPRERELADRNDWVSNLSVSTRVFQETQLALLLAGDIRPASSAPGTTVIDRRLTGSAQRRLFAERAKISASIFIGEAEYQGPGTNEGEVSGTGEYYNGRQDEYWGLSTQVDVWVAKNLSLGIAYAYTENRGALNGTTAQREANAYDAGRWQARLSWNY